jgi:hypothetical protein
MPLVENRTTYIIVILLVAVFTALFSIRILLAPEDKLPVGDVLWEVAISVSLKSDKKPHVIRVATPIDTEHARVVSQKFTYPGMRMTRLRSQSADSSNIVLRTQEAGQLQFEAEYTIQTSTARRWLVRPTHPLKDAEQRQHYLQAEPDIETDNEAVINTLAKLTATVEDNTGLTTVIFNYVANHILNDPKTPNDSAEQVLAKKRGSVLGKANAIVALCRAAGIPARIVTGIVLSESFNAPLDFWTEVYLDNDWRSYAPAKGYAGKLPPNFVPLKYGSSPLAQSNDLAELQTELSVLPAVGAARLLNTEQANWLDILDLTRLSVAMQDTLSSLLLLPFGALLTVVFRQILGLRSYGTFTSALLALAVIHAEWITIIFILLSVLAFAVSGRALVGHHMSRVPRLTVIFTLVALSMGFAVSAMEYLELSPGPQVVLLPIIILTGLIDHIYRTAEESGLKISMLRLWWTCVVSFLCYLLFRIDFLAQWTLRFPEIHLLTVAAALMMNLYYGKKLTSLPAFEWLAEPKSKEQEKKKKAPSDKLRKQPVSLEP